MFNEAFWFFYLVSIAENVSFICGVVIIVAMLALSVCAIYIAAEEDWALPLAGKTFLPILIVASLIGTFVPSKDALYAGAAQYVGESVEVDQTLLRLKEVIDERIEELAKPDSEQ